jgi:hypothetical protein
MRKLGFYKYGRIITKFIYIKDFIIKNIIDCILLYMKEDEL